MQGDVRPRWAARRNQSDHENGDDGWLDGHDVYNDDHDEQPTDGHV